MGILQKFGVLRYKSTNFAGAAGHARGGRIGRGFGLADFRAFWQYASRIASFLVVVEMGVTPGVKTWRPVVTDWLQVFCKYNRNKINGVAVVDFGMSAALACSAVWGAEGVF